MGFLRLREAVRAAAVLIAVFLPIASLSQPMTAPARTNARALRRVNILAERGLAQSVSLNHDLEAPPRPVARLDVLFQQLREAAGIDVREHPWLANRSLAIAVDGQPLRIVLESIRRALPGTDWYRTGETYMLAPRGAPVDFALLTREERDQIIGVALRQMLSGLTDENIQSLMNGDSVDLHRGNLDQRRSAALFSQVWGTNLGAGRAVRGMVRLQLRTGGSWELLLTVMSATGWAPVMDIPVPQHNLAHWR